MPAPKDLWVIYNRLDASKCREVHDANASQTLQGEMVQETLIGTLLRPALEETEAQRALLISSPSAELRTAAEATRRHKTMLVRLRDEVANESLLPGSVLHYVLKTRESVVKDDAAAQATFAPEGGVDSLPGAAQSSKTCRRTPA